MLLSFLSGSTACGFLIKSSKLSGAASYGSALLVVALLLVCSRFAGETMRGIYLAACAMGLQNALFTTYTGAVLRTTHVTGTLTDIGLLLGRLISRRLRQLLHGSQPLHADEAVDEDTEVLRLQLLVPLFASFLLGALSGGLLEERSELNAILVPASLSAALSVAYAAFRLFVWRDAVVATLASGQSLQGAVEEGERHRSARALQALRAGEEVEMADERGRRAASQPAAGWGFGGLRTGREYEQLQEEKGEEEEEEDEPTAVEPAPAPAASDEFVVLN